MQIPLANLEAGTLMSLLGSNRQVAQSNSEEMIFAARAPARGSGSFKDLLTRAGQQGTPNLSAVQKQQETSTPQVQENSQVKVGTEQAKASEDKVSPPAQDAPVPAEAVREATAVDDEGSVTAEQIAGMLSVLPVPAIEVALPEEAAAAPVLLTDEVSMEPIVDMLPMQMLSERVVEKGDAEEAFTDLISSAQTQQTEQTAATSAETIQLQAQSVSEVTQQQVFEHSDQSFALQEVTVTVTANSNLSLREANQGATADQKTELPVSFEEEMQTPAVVEDISEQQNTTRETESTASRPIREPAEVNSTKPEQVTQSKEAVHPGLHLQLQEDIKAVTMPATQNSSTATLTGQISKWMETLKAGNVRLEEGQVTAMEMTLHPRNLGKLVLKLEMENGELRAFFATQSQIVKQALETQMNDLKDLLQEQGLTVAQLSVQISSGQREAPQFGENMNNANNRQQLSVTELSSVPNTDVRLAADLWNGLMGGRLYLRI